MEYVAFFASYNEQFNEFGDEDEGIEKMHLGWDSLLDNSEGMITPQRRHISC